MDARIVRGKLALLTNAAVIDSRPVNDWQARLAGSPLWKAVGCERCLEGYGGRKGLFELMLCEAPVRAAIRQGNLAAADLRQVAIASGMRPLIDDALAKLKAGTTDLREVAGALSV